jgi:hypothetical protein
MSEGSVESQPVERFCFRQRFELAPGGRLPFEEQVVVLQRSGEIEIELRSLEEKPIKESQGASLWGMGYPTEDEARAAGNHWRSAFQRALAAINLGANFGLRNPNMGGFTDEVLAQIKAETGAVIYRDSWDVLVFPASDPPPRFSSMSGAGQVVSPLSVAQASIDASMSITEGVNEVAYDLYTASMRSSHIADARVVLLVMAIECLVTRAQRDAKSVDHIEQLVEITLQNEELESNDRDALANALRGLRYESIRRATRTLSRQVEATNHTEDPVALIDEAFGMRNALVHGGSRPELDRVRYVGAVLERMVGELIAGASVAAGVQRARLDLKEAK